MCYYCEPCQAWVGCHKESKVSLGRLADKRLRKLKHHAHVAFDPLWEDGHMTRSEAYKTMSLAFGLPAEQTHIGMFDEDMCMRVIQFSETILTFINGK